MQWGYIIMETVRNQTKSIDIQCITMASLQHPTLVVRCIFLINNDMLPRYWSCDTHEMYLFNAIQCFFQNVYQTKLLNTFNNHSVIYWTTKLNWHFKCNAYRRLCQHLHFVFVWWFWKYIGLCTKLRWTWSEIWWRHVKALGNYVLSVIQTYKSTNRPINILAKMHFF